MTSSQKALEADINVVALVCSLKPSPAPSSSELIASHLFEHLRREGAVCESIRCVDFSILPGVEADMGDGDDWPAIRAKVLTADILIISTPTWMGNMSSVAQRVLERLDAELSYTDDADRPHVAGKVALAAVVGNEDGAHKIVADLFQGLNDVGYSIPAQGCTYWNGAAMQSTDYNDLDKIPDAVASATAAAARNAMHLATVLRDSQYPAYS
ncbi:flavodoxin [Mycolicibacterium cyprinidarum]|nr:flavodoxin [Mycolicibacterium sp. NGTWS1803]